MLWGLQKQFQLLCICKTIGETRNPTHTFYFIKSENDYHTNLSWLLECNSYYGELPFGENEYVMKDIINNILNQKVSFYEIETSDKEEQKLNEQFVNIIKMCLNKDAKKRPNVNEIEKLF